MRLSARPSLVAISCCRLVPSSYLLAFRLTDTVCRVACPLLPGFPSPLLSSISTLSALQVSVVVPSGSLLRCRVESSRCGPPSGSSLSQTSIGTMALPPPSWCLELRNVVTLTGRVCLRSRSERVIAENAIS